MQLELTTSEYMLCVQRNLAAGSSDYARVMCILMLAMGKFTSFCSRMPGIDSAMVYCYPKEKFRRAIRNFSIT